MESKGTINSSKYNLTSNRGSFGEMYSERGKKYIFRTSFEFLSNFLEGISFNERIF